MEHSNTNPNLSHMLSENDLTSLCYTLAGNSGAQILKERFKERDMYSIANAKPFESKRLTRVLFHELFPYYGDRDLINKVLNNHSYEVDAKIWKTSMGTVLYTRDKDAVWSVFSLVSKYNTVEWNPKESYVVNLFLETLRRANIYMKSGEATVKVTSSLDQKTVHDLISNNNLTTIKPVLNNIIGITFWYQDPKRVEECILKIYEWSQRLVSPYPRISL